MSAATKLRPGAGASLVERREDLGLAFVALAVLRPVLAGVRKASS
jgi:hypothetical protein